MFQTDPSLNNYITCFVLFNSVLIISYIYARNDKPKIIVWILALIFCLFAKWEQDYFAFRIRFLSERFRDWRDPAYYYIAQISGSSYILFRFFIWGSALLFFKKTCKRFQLSSNLAIYVLVVLYLLTFSYPRAILAMSIYFYGLSYIVKPTRLPRTINFLVGFGIIISSYVFHRSLLPLICLSPLAFFRLTKANFICMMLLLPIGAFALKNILFLAMEGELTQSESLEAFSESAQLYSSRGGNVSYNWKFALILNLRTISIYVVYVYLLWKFIFSKYRIVIHNYIKQYMVICSCIIAIALIFFEFVDIGATGLLGRRYLYMVGIPLAVLLTYAYQYRLCNWKTLNLLLVLSLMYVEGVLIGKILSY